MKIKVPQKVKESINKLGNKTAKANGLKIYAALYLNENRKNNHGYFAVPSTYLESINKRYNRAINQFLQDGIIDYYKRSKIDPNDIFNTIWTKYYDKNRGVCMKYRFLIDIKDGEEIEVSMATNKKYKWYSKIEKSLIELGYEVEITRDSFGRRVHHPIIPVYKEELKNKGFALIDAKASQPKLLLNLMKQKGIIDEEYEKAFTKDFYNFVVSKLNLENRKQAKDLFMYWLNSAGYVPNYKIHLLFPTASAFIKSLKNKNYKDAASFLQREEAKIWIDDLLENIPADFALPIHDCLIIKDKDAEEVFEYCKNKYKEIDFTISYI